MTGLLGAIELDPLGKMTCPIPLGFSSVPKLRAAPFVSVDIGRVRSTRARATVRAGAIWYIRDGEWRGQDGGKRERVGVGGLAVYFISESDGVLNARP